MFCKATKKSHAADSYFVAGGPFRVSCSLYL